MIDNLNQNIDDTEANMIRVEGKMNNLLKKSNTCTLMCILISEFVVLILLILIKMHVI